MGIVVNASPLIFLSKLNKLDILGELFEDVFTTDEVAVEVLAGLEYGYSDALVVKKSIEEKRILLLKSTKSSRFENLGAGERSVIEAALEHKVGRVLLDDLTAIKVARYFGLNVSSTPFVLLLALKNKKIEKQEFVRLFDKLITDFNYRISPVLYKEIMQFAEKE
ncbi:MAG: hypothetical protein AABW86_05225 [Candidatus Micrarchaeota archaeon]